MDYVRQIIGEAKPKDDEKEGEGESEPKSEPKVVPKAAPAGEAAANEEPDTEIQELAGLWQTGNKGDLLRRFMEMDNETAVKVVFAIGREGALELARMADQEALGTEGEMAGAEAESDYPVGAMLGREGATPPAAHSQSGPGSAPPEASTEPASVEPPKQGRQWLGREFFRGLNPMG